MATVANFPHHPAAPTVAVIPEDHPLYALYGGRNELLDYNVETGVLGPEFLPYKVEQWLPKRPRVRPRRPHRVYFPVFDQLGLPHLDKRPRATKGRKRK